MEWHASYIAFSPPPDWYQRRAYHTIAMQRWKPTNCFFNSVVFGRFLIAPNWGIFSIGAPHSGLVGGRDVHTDRLFNFQHKHDLSPYVMVNWLRWWKEHREMTKCVFENRDFEGRIYQINTDLHGRLLKQIALWPNMIEVLCTGRLIGVFWMICKENCTARLQKYLSKMRSYYRVESKVQIQ